MNNEAEIAKLVGVMAAAYPHAKLTEATVEVYVALLKDIPLPVVMASVEQCTAESEFFPTVAKVREKALTLTSPTVPEPLEAWMIVLTAITQFGFYRRPVFDNPIIARAVDCIGWQTLCSSENQVADRAHFSKIYEQLVAREIQDAKLLPRAREMRRQIQAGPVKEIGNGREF